MSRKLKDKYRRLYDITSPGYLSSEDNVAEEKLIKVIATGLDFSTSVRIEVKTLSDQVWTQIGTIERNTTKIFDISLYDQIRYNVYTFGGISSTIEIVSAVESDQNVIEKDRDENDALRVLDVIPIGGDSKTAFLRALLDLKFWETIGFDTSTINFVTTDDNEPVLDVDGQFIEV